ncbi:MAG: hypothetical protein MHMPM18_000656 [Marteilia pararefringens]
MGFKDKEQRRARQQQIESKVQSRIFDKKANAELARLRRLEQKEYEQMVAALKAQNRDKAMIHAKNVDRYKTLQTKCEAIRSNSTQLKDDMSLATLNMESTVNLVKCTETCSKDLNDLNLKLTRMNFSEIVSDQYIAANVLEDKVSDALTFSNQQTSEKKIDHILNQGLSEIGLEAGIDVSKVEKVEVKDTEKNQKIDVEEFSKYLSNSKNF